LIPSIDDGSDAEPDVTPKSDGGPKPDAVSNPPRDHDKPADKRPGKKSGDSKRGAFPSLFIAKRLGDDIFDASDDDASTPKVKPPEDGSRGSSISTKKRAGSSVSAKLADDSIFDALDEDIPPKPKSGRQVHRPPDEDAPTKRPGTSKTKSAAGTSRASVSARLADESIFNAWEEVAPANKSTRSDESIPITPGGAPKPTTSSSRPSFSAKPPKLSVSSKVLNDDGLAPRKKHAALSSRQLPSTRLADDSIFDAWEEVAPRRPDSAATPKSTVDDDASKAAEGVPRKPGSQWEAVMPRRSPVDDQSGFTTPRRKDGQPRKDEEAAPRAGPARPNGCDGWDTGEIEDGEGWF
jgi:hypothetical protein